MSGLREIMDELAATLETAFAGLQFADDTVIVQVTPRMNVNPTPPCVDIYPGDPFSDGVGAAFGDRGEIVFTVRARVDTADQTAGQDLLLELMDDASDFSVATALLADQSLNDLASSVNVEGPSGYTQFVDPGGQGALLGVTFRVTVMNWST